MSDVEYIANMAEIISGLAVIIGIGFGVVEYLRHKANERRELNGPQAWEWYQWLVEQIAESHRQSPRVPAHIAHQS